MSSPESITATGTVPGAIPLLRIPADLRELLNSSLRPLRQQATACDVALTLEIDETVPRLISIDPAKIAWAMTALVGNALRYVHHGTRLMPGGSIHIRAAYNPAASEISLEIRDDGPGIPPDRLSTLFTTRPGEVPAALGLLMIRDVVTAHGGTLAVFSGTARFDRGTTVRLTLPAS